MDSRFGSVADLGSSIAVGLHLTVTDELFMQGGKD